MVMTCRHAQELRDAYLDGELSSSIAAEVHAHLLQCPECQRQYEMVRAAGNVIAKDEPPAGLPDDFAARVLAGLPNMKEQPAATGILPRREQRRRTWRKIGSAAFPAVAAILFFSVIIWPTAEIGNRRTAVRGTSAVQGIGVDEMVESTLHAFDDTRNAAESVGQILSMSMDEAHKTMQRDIEEAKKPQTSIMDIFLEPFTGMLEETERPATDKDGQEIVRF